MSTFSHFLTKNFGLTEENTCALSECLYDMSGFIAGGAALYAHLGEDAPADQDIDIWIPTMTQRNPEYNDCIKMEKYDTLRSIALSKAASACYAYDKKIVGQMKDLLVSFGYKDNNMCTKRYCIEHHPSGVIDAYDLPYHTNPEFQKIVKAIHDFKHPESGRKIQVIYFYGNADPLNNFDLDICKVQIRPCIVYDKYDWFNASSEEVMRSVRAREMQITNMSYIPNLTRRIDKYWRRGFTLLSDDDGHRMTDEEVGEFLTNLR